MEQQMKKSIERVQTCQMYIQLVVFLLFFCVPNGYGMKLEYDFSEGMDGWIAGFADYSIEMEENMELQSSWERLPAPLDSTQSSFCISGNNHSDDLFMFIKKHITGLVPNTIYNITVHTEFASNAPQNSVGVGGSPGEGVIVKFGAVQFEPKVIQSQDDYFYMNLDKGNQTVPGPDMDTIGNVAKIDGDESFTYALISRDNQSHPFTVKSNADGELWVILGTDSGFESTTTLYYNKIFLTFGIETSVIEEISTIENYEGAVILGITDGRLLIEFAQADMYAVEIHSLNGRLLEKSIVKFEQGRQHVQLSQRYTVPVIVSIHSTVTKNTVAREKIVLQK